MLIDFCKLSGAQKHMEDLDKIIRRLYEDSVLGKLSDLRFQKLSARYSDIQELDAATVNKLIEKNIIHSQEKINGR